MIQLGPHRKSIHGKIFQGVSSISLIEEAMAFPLSHGHCKAQVERAECSGA